MVLMGIDPSFKGFGVSVIDFDTKTISSYKLFSDIERMDFKHIGISIDSLLSSFKSLLISTKVDAIIMETPPPVAKFSAGLYALDYSLSRLFKNMNIPVYGVTCTYIGHIHKDRKWTKSKSVSLVKNLVSGLLSLGYTSDLKFESNQCESFIILCRLCCLYDSDIKGYLLEQNNKFNDSLEFEL